MDTVRVQSILQFTCISAKVKRNEYCLSYEKKTRGLSTYWSNVFRINSSFLLLTNFESSNPSTIHRTNVIDYINNPIIPKQTMSGYRFMTQQQKILKICNRWQMLRNKIQQLGRFRPDAVVALISWCIFWNICKLSCNRGYQRVSWIRIMLVI